MNRTDLFACAVTQVIRPATLAAFVAAAVDDGPIAAERALLGAVHGHVLTTRYELVPSEIGVTGRADGGAVAEMSWIEVASILASVATSERAGELRSAVSDRSHQASFGADDGLIDHLQAEYAHAAAIAGGLLDPPLRNEAVSGFDIQLRSTTQRTTVFVNRTELFDLRPHRITADVEVRPHLDPDTCGRVAGFASTVTFVPQGDSNAPTPKSAGERVGIERLGPDRVDGAKWALQIDGFDTVIIEAFHRQGVRVAVYDSDPSQDYLRFETSFPIDAVPAAAERRLAKLCVRRIGRER